MYSFYRVRLHFGVDTTVVRRYLHCKSAASHPAQKQKVTKIKFSGKPKNQPKNRMPSDNKIVCLHIGGMSCVSCARTVSSALDAVHSVARSEVNAVAATAKIYFLPAAQVASPEELVEAVEAVGFSAEVVSHPTRGGGGLVGNEPSSIREISSVEAMERRRLEETLEWRTAFFLACIFTVPCFLLAMVFPMSVQPTLT